MRHAVLPLLLAALPVQADLTVRYSVEMTTGPGLSPRAAAAIREAAGPAVTELIYYFRRDGVVHFQYGDFVILLDPATRKQVMMNVAEQTFLPKALAPAEAMAEEAEEIRKLATSGDYRVDLMTPAVARMLHGYLTEQVRLDMKPTGDATATRFQVTVAHATEAEMGAKPVLRTFRTVSGGLALMRNPLLEIARPFAPDPEMMALLQTMTSDLRQGRLLVRCEVGVIAPELGNDKTPVLTLRMQLTEIKEGDLPAALFRIPDDYQERQ